jgi:hypothetical protein
VGLHRSDPEKARISCTKEAARSLLEWAFMNMKNQPFVPIAPAVRRRENPGASSSAGQAQTEISIDVRLDTAVTASAKKWYPVVEGTSFQPQPSESAERAIAQMERELTQDPDWIYVLPRSGDQYKTLAEALEKLRSLNTEE